MKNTVLLKKRDAVCALFKIITMRSFYFFAAVFLLVITTAHAMLKTAESKIPLSSGKNMVFSVFTVDSGENYNTLMTAFDSIIAGTITFQIISNAKNAVALNASVSGLEDYSSVWVYAAGTGHSISGTIANPSVNFNGAYNIVANRKLILLKLLKI